MKKRSVVSLLIVLSMLLSGSVVSVAQASQIDSYISNAAAFEDSALSLWFDYSSEKTSKSTTADTGKESFTVYMAKNEIENAQFFLSSSTDRSGMTATVTDFTNESGDTLSSELFIEYYHDCGKYGKIPDAIPPLSAYGPFSLTAGTSQGFLIKLKSTADTVAGKYSATLSVFDSQSKEVKSATVYANVWNFTMSEKTECATSVNLSYNYLINTVQSSLTGPLLYKAYYDYLLENRVCSYYLPQNPNNAKALVYMDNPRVTSYQLATYTGGDLADYSLQKIFGTYFAGEENAHRFDKAYYFSNVVDSDTPAKLEALRAAYDKFLPLVESYKPAYAASPFNFISTYIYDIDYPKADGTVIDQIEYYKDFVNLWCSKTFAYTDTSELSVPGAKILQPAKWDNVYGTFKERMAQRRSEGQKVWWFISWDVEAPYINYYMQTDGTAQRLLFWQQFDNDVQGFLYNFSNFWTMGAADPYASSVTSSAYPEAYGESILIYPGDVYGLDKPVGSLRLEAMRDGIEDYQMLYMLKELAGRDAADSYIDRLTTGMVTYNTDDELYYNTRVALGNKIDELTNTSTCEHQFKNGVCTLCGAYDEIMPGDVNFDGKINLMDLVLLKTYIKGLCNFTEPQISAADLTVDLRVNLNDIVRMKMKLKNFI